MDNKPNLDDIFSKTSSTDIMPTKAPVVDVDNDGNVIKTNDIKPETVNEVFAKPTTKQQEPTEIIDDVEDIIEEDEIIINETIAKSEPVESVEEDKEEDEIQEVEAKAYVPETNGEVIIDESEFVIDSNSHNNKSEISASIVKNDFSETLRSMPLLFNKISDIKTPKTSSDSPLAMLNELKHFGEYIDVYLPMSNIGVRIFEFENKTFVSENYNRIYQWVDDMDYLADIRLVSASRKLMQQIKENCVFLCKDSSTIDMDTAIDSLSKHDVDMLLLATSALLVYLENNKENWKYTLNAVCPKCGADVIMNIDLLDLLRDQYKNMTDEEKKANLQNYSMEETFMEKLTKSSHSRKLRLSYSRGNGNDMRKISVVVADPTYKADLDVEDRIYTHVLSKYKALVETYSKDIYGFATNTNRRKVGLLHDAISMQAGNQITDDISSFYSDLMVANLIPYINRIEFENYSTSTKVYYMHELTTQEALDLILKLPQALLEKINKAIASIVSKGVKPISLTYTCATCKEDSVAEYPPIHLFLFAVRQVTENIE